jgi:hypothetical protein
MVEMLGVLAIIGVLSIGSLAGYRAAMKKYDLNRHTQQIEAFFAGFCDYVRATRHASRSNGDDPIAPAIQANFLPDDMINPSDKTQIIDYYGNKISATYDSANKSYFIYFRTPTKDVCLNLLQFTKRNTDTLQFVAKYVNEDAAPFLYGTQSCKTGTLCLDAMTFSELNDWCLTYCSSGCSIRTSFYVEKMI